MKNYLLLGISYCGSTLLSLLLGKAEGVFSVGEAHWLLHGQPQCYICAKNCSFYGEDFLKKLDWDNLTSQIAKKAKEEHGCNIVLYSDKNEKFYRRLFEHNHPDALILLFKNPKAFVASWLKHNPPSNPRQRKAHIKKAIRQYELGYSLNLSYAKQSGAKIIKVYYDDLISNLPQKLKAICLQLDIKYSHDLTNLSNLPAKLHQVGGNFRVNSNFLNRPIELDNSWMTYLTTREVEIIDNSIANEIFEKRLYCKEGLA